MAEFRELYGDALVYDVVFDRPVEAETAFMERLFAREAGREMTSFLEVACGPGYHARHMARAGKRAAGFDLEESMIAFARDQAASTGSPAGFFAADMRAFAVPERYDAAAAMLDGIDSLQTFEELCDHFRCVADALEPGGLYFLDNMHPREVNVWHYEPVIYAGEKNGTRVTITYGVEPPELDPVRQVARARTMIEVERDGTRTVSHSEAVERFITVQEVVAIASATGTFDLVGVWGGFDEAIGFGDPAATRMIIVLRKR
ncbi:class I SAM-dependent DNA methyltransferase [Salinarimonas sp. NSM]|uniref:class I SAM-dependent DNA methyltransferase n=1 Tax=Salinarimonas sp. NSM TaxID=3458003 RepID=UPI0040365FAE